jgi:hypothetical protein
MYLATLARKLEGPMICASVGRPRTVSCWLVGRMLTLASSVDMVPTTMTLPFDASVTL